MTGGGEIGRAVIAAAGGGRPIRGQAGIDRAIGRDDQQIRPIAKVGDNVIAGTDGETVSPRAASQPIIARPPEQRIGIGRADQGHVGAIACIAH